MNFFEDLKASLRHKWLDYYRLNRSWIKGVYNSHVNISGNEYRPHSFFILSTLSILEPNLLQIFPALCQLNNNPDKLIEVLGLNFDPDIALDQIQAQNTKLLEGQNDE